MSQFRIAQALSREKLAARAGLSARTIYNLERSIGKPRAITLVAVARALGHEVEDIFPTTSETPTGTSGDLAKLDDCSVEDIFPKNESSPRAAAPGSTKTADASGGRGSR